MVNYQAYIQSSAWADFCKRYRESRMPQSCRACLSKTFQLHHVTYKRLGSEWLGDVVPLCKSCHERLHAESPKAGKGGIEQFRAELCNVFGLQSGEAARRLAAWMNRKPGRPVKLKKFELKENKKRNKVKAAMERDRVYHTYMCERR